MNWCYRLTSPTSAAFPVLPPAHPPVVIQSYIRDLAETTMLSTAARCGHTEQLTTFISYLAHFRLRLPNQHHQRKNLRAVIGIT